MQPNQPELGPPFLINLCNETDFTLVFAFEHTGVVVLREPRIQYKLKYKSSATKAGFRLLDIPHIFINPRTRDENLPLPSQIIQFSCMMPGRGGFHMLLNREIVQCREL